MVGFPAARITDMHTCPMCLGAPFPILPPAMVTVLVGGLPAARMTDLCACLIPALVPIPSVDPIAFGSPTVLIGSLPAARQFDPTMKGGAIILGLPTVLIGIVATPAPGEPGALNIWEEVLPDGTTVTHVGPNITIVGTKAYRDAVVQDLKRLDSTPTGHDLLNSLNAPGKGPVKIVASTGGEQCERDGAGGEFEAGRHAGVWVGQHAEL